MTSPADDAALIKELHGLVPFLATHHCDPSPLTKAIARLTALNAGLSERIEEGERLRGIVESLGGGCDANDGGLHSCMGTGKDAFCPDCGLMLRRVAYVLPHIKPTEARAALSTPSRGGHDAG